MEPTTLVPFSGAPRLSQNLWRPFPTLVWFYKNHHQCQQPLRPSLGLREHSRNGDLFWSATPRSIACSENLLCVELFHTRSAREVEFPSTQSSCVWKLSDKVKFSSVLHTQVKVLPSPLSILVLRSPAHGEHVKHTSRPFGVRHSRPRSQSKLMTLYSPCLLSSSCFVLRLLHSPREHFELRWRFFSPWSRASALVRHLDHDDRCLSLFTQHFEKFWWFFTLFSLFLYKTLSDCNGAFS